MSIEKIVQDTYRLMEGCISSLECAHRIVSQECDQELVDKLETDGESDAVYYSKKLADLRKRLSAEVIRRKTGEEAGREIENFVNIMSNVEENKKFVDYIVYNTHRTLNQSLIGLFVEVMKEEAKQYDTQRYDARNEAAVKFCKRILPIIEETYFPLI